MSRDSLTLVEFLMDVTREFALPDQTWSEELTLGELHVLLCRLRPARPRGEIWEWLSVRLLELETPPDLIDPASRLGKL
jgi:hypothetical protein